MEESKRNLFTYEKTNYFRFSEEQLAEQAHELAVYILSELSEDNLESIQEGIAEVKKLTGLDISVEDAIAIRKKVADSKNEFFKRTK